MPGEGFMREVERELIGQETEPDEIIYFKLHKSKIPVIEQAGDRNGSFDARDGQVTGVLSGDDLWLIFWLERI